MGRGILFDCQQNVVVLHPRSALGFSVIDPCQRARHGRERRVGNVGQASCLSHILLQDDSASLCFIQVLPSSASVSSFITFSASGKTIRSSRSKCVRDAVTARSNNCRASGSRLAAFTRSKLLSISLCSCSKLSLWPSCSR